LTRTLWSALARCCCCCCWQRRWRTPRGRRSPRSTVTTTSTTRSTRRWRRRKPRASSSAAAAAACTTTAVRTASTGPTPARWGRSSPRREAAASTRTRRRRCRRQRGCLHHLRNGQVLGRSRQELHPVPNRQVQREDRAGQLHLVRHRLHHEGGWLDGGWGLRPAAEGGRRARRQPQRFFNLEQRHSRLQVPLWAFVFPPRLDLRSQD